MCLTSDVKGFVMARKTLVILEDDIDGGEAAETVTFGLDGTSYEIDLSNANAEKLRDALAPFIAAARKAPARTGRRSSRSNGAGNAAEIRAWAKSQGLQVPERGRIPAEVRQAWDAR